MQQYFKAIASVIAAVVAFFATAVIDGVTVSDWVNGAVALVTAFGVYMIPNMPHQPWAKATVAVLGGMLMVLASAVTDHTVTLAEWLNIILAGFAAVGVATVANPTPAEVAASRASLQDSTVRAALQGSTV